MDAQQREQRRIAQRSRRARMSAEQHQTQLATRRNRRRSQRLQAAAATQQTQSVQNINPQVLHKFPTTRNCGRNFLGNIRFHKHMLPPPTFCPFCAAKRFNDENSQACCSNGKFHVFRPPPPQQLLNLFVDQTEIGIHFRSNIRSYNNAFAFTSMGANIDQDLANATRGVYSYRAQGSIYHRIGSILPPDGNRPRYLQLYIYDTEHETENRQLDTQILRSNILLIIQQVLDTVNPFVSVLRQLGQRSDLHNCRIKIKEITVDSHVHELPTASQVAGIIVGDESDDLHGRDIIVRTNSGTFQRVPDTAGFYDPLQYPLLLPYGEHGWNLNVHDNGDSQLSCASYYSNIIQIRPGETTLLLLAGRLLQQYAVDMFVKIETMRLRFLRDNQQTIRAELYQGLHDAFAAGETSAANVGVKKILPASHMGSPRDMHHRYQDAMAVVQRYGKPDFFITITCNTSWPEITNELLPGQLPQDRPDITCRIFRAKLNQLKTDLFDSGVLGKVIAHVHVIEFQKRGLPHAHMLIIVAENDKLNSPDDYDSVVRAEIPCIDLEPDLHMAVVKHMIHHPCGPFNPRATCMKNGECKRNFPKPFAPITLQGNDSYPIYRRRDNIRVPQANGHALDNRWVVPYNPYLLLKYDCHLNVEICSSIESVKYLYKYVYKGFDRVSVGVSAANNEDEISNYANARWICAPEALWRIFKFSLNNITPSVIALQIHLPNEQQLRYSSSELLHDVLNDATRSKTMLTEYFTTNVYDDEARQYFYHQFPEKFWWDKKNKLWIRRRNNLKVLGRIYTVSPAEGERYFLRLLLIHVRGSLSFTDLLTVDGHQYNTFKEAANHRGLLENDDDIYDCLMSASTTHMPAALRRLFTMILVYCEPVNVRQLWEQFYVYMIEDYQHTYSVTDNLFYIELCLSDIDVLLRQYNKTLSDFDFPANNITLRNNRNMSSLLLSEKSIPIPPEDIDSVHSLNLQQRTAFDAVMNSIYENKNSIFFIDGPGGTGKTYVYRSILAHSRSKGYISLAVATSGIAAIALPGGRTAHSRFKIPIALDSSSTCHVPKQSDLAKLLTETRVILWDEATMAHRHAFEALDKTLRDLTNVDIPFGGKVVILGGDFRQVLPIVSNGTRSQTVDACIIKSYLWSYVTVYHLTQNMRAVNDPSYADFLLRIGNGDEPYVQDDMIKLPDDIVISSSSDSISTLINHVFPSLPTCLHSTDYIMTRAILAPTNDTVDTINDTVIHMFPGSEYTYYSFDSVEDDTHNLYQPEFLSSLSPGGLPPHKLTLKIGSPIMLLRNIDPKIGLCNGIRLICRVFHRNLIDAEIAVGHFRGTRVFIPRIPLKPSENVSMPFNLIRKQFPVKLAFALTINKSQGQTIPNVGIYLPHHVFSHGQLYVALSRGVAQHSTRILVQNGTIQRKDGTHTRNVVYKDVLLACSTDIN